MKLTRRAVTVAIIAFAFICLAIVGPSIVSAKVGLPVWENAAFVMITDDEQPDTHTRTVSYSGTRQEARELLLWALDILADDDSMGKQ